MTTAKRTQPNVLELDVVLATVVVVVVGCDVVVVACARVVVVAGIVVVVVGAVVGGTVVVVVGATVVVVTGAVVVVRVLRGSGARQDAEHDRRAREQEEKRDGATTNLRMHLASLRSVAGPERGPPKPYCGPTFGRLAVLSEPDSG